MKVLDLYCGVGGASMGYHLAGCKVTGIDKIPQPNYPFKFICDDVISYLENNDVSEYDFIHASPPCQEYSVASVVAKKQGKTFDDLLAITRSLLIKTNIPYVIENVPNAPIRKDLFLYGYMFNLPVIRKRFFEFSDNIFIMQPNAPKQKGSVKTGDFITVAGNGYPRGAGKTKGKLLNLQHLTLLENRKIAMDIHWAKTMKEVTNSIPPQYTKYIFDNVKTLLKPQ